MLLMVDVTVRRGLPARSNAVDATPMALQQRAACTSWRLGDLVPKSWYFAGLARHSYGSEGTHVSPNSGNPLSSTERVARRAKKNKLNPESRDP